GVHKAGRWNAPPDIPSPVDVARQRPRDATRRAEIEVDPRRRLTRAECPAAMHPPREPARIEARAGPENQPIGAVVSDQIRDRTEAEPPTLKAAHRARLDQPARLPPQLREVCRLTEPFDPPLRIDRL